MGAGGAGLDDGGSLAAAEVVLATSVAVSADVEAIPAAEDIDVIIATNPSNAPAILPAAVAAAASAPLVAAADTSVSSPAEEANVAVTMVPFTGSIPAIASSWSNAIPMDANCAWRYEDIAEAFSLVVKKIGSALGISVTQLKDNRGWVEDVVLLVEFWIEDTDLVTDVVLVEFWIEDTKLVTDFWVDDIDLIV